MKVRVLLLLAACLVPVVVQAQRERTDSQFSGSFKIDGKSQQLWISHDRSSKQTTVCNGERTPVCSVTPMDAISVVPIGKEAKLLVQRSPKDFVLCSVAGPGLALNCAPTKINDHLATVSTDRGGQISFVMGADGTVCGFEEKAGMRCSAIQRPGGSADAHFGAFNQPSGRSDEVLFLRQDGPVVCGTDARFGCKTVEGLKPVAWGASVVATRVAGSKRSVLISYKDATLTTCYPYGSNLSKVTFSCEETTLAAGEQMTLRLTKHRDRRQGDTAQFFMIPSIDRAATSQKPAEGGMSEADRMPSALTLAIEAANSKINRLLREKVRYIAELNGERLDLVAQDDRVDNSDWRLVLAGDGYGVGQTVEITTTRIKNEFDVTLLDLEVYSDTFDFLPVTREYFIPPPPTCAERRSTCDRDYSKRADVCDVLSGVVLAAGVVGTAGGSVLIGVLSRSWSGFSATAGVGIGLTGTLAATHNGLCKANASLLRLQCNDGC